MTINLFFIETEEVFEHVCIENVLHTGELLFPSHKELVKRQGNPTLKSPGKAMTEFKSSIRPYFRQYIVDRKNTDKNVAQIYNEGMGGYLNAYDNIIDSERRDVFIGDDRQDFWRIHRHPTIDGAVALENLPTGEFLYSVTGEKGKHLLYYPEQTSRSVFLWRFGSVQEALKDNSSLWFLKECLYKKI